MKIKGHYILYNDPDSDGRKTIYIRYYKSGFAIKRSTGVKVLPADWDKNAGLFVPSSPAAKRLNWRFRRKVTPCVRFKVTPLSDFKMTPTFRFKVTPTFRLKVTPFEIS